MKLTIEVEAPSHADTLMLLEAVAEQLRDGQVLGGHRGSQGWWEFAIAFDGPDDLEEEVLG